MLWALLQNNGCNYKYSGCWKVYGDETYSRRLFAQYKSCKAATVPCLKKCRWEFIELFMYKFYDSRQESVTHGRILQLFIGVEQSNTESMANAIAEGIAAAGSTADIMSVDQCSPD